MIPPETVDEIIASAKIEEVIEDYVNLKRRGVNMLGLCPFHNEKTPSFTVSPSKNLFKCFGCGKGGSSVTFLMEHEQFTYPEALRYLADKYNIRIQEEEKTDEQKQRDQERQSYFIINEFAQEFFERQLFDTQEGKSVGLSYFKHRGLLENTIKTFRLGYSPKDSKTFYQAAVQKGYNIEKLSELGLISSSGYDFYRERVIFPFHNISGKTIGFGGRILRENKKAPKYLNSPESNIYNKRKTLYGLYQAKTEIRKRDQCLLVEGYTDVLSLYQNGIKNVVASSGTSLTVEQVQLIKRFSLNVIVLYDGDQAGQNAALRGLDIFLENDLNVKIATIPDQLDPDSYIRQIGTDQFQSFIKDKATDFVLTLAENIEKTYTNDPINKSIQVKELTNSLVKIGDQLKRSLYIKECSAILHIEENTLIAEVNRKLNKVIYKKQNDLRREERRSTPQPVEGELPPISKDTSQESTNKLYNDFYQERDVVRVLLQHGHKICSGQDDITGAQYLKSLIAGLDTQFKSGQYRQIVTEYFAQSTNNTSSILNNFIEHTDAAIKKLAINLLADKDEYANWQGKGVELQTQKPVEENHEKDIKSAVDQFLFNLLKSSDFDLDRMITELDDPDKEKILLKAKAMKILERKTHADNIGRVVL